jgi:hypothetical protein
VFVALTAVAAAVAVAFVPFAARAGTVAQQAQLHPGPTSEPDIAEHTG